MLLLKNFIDRLQITIAYVSIKKMSHASIEFY